MKKFWRELSWAERTYLIAGIFWIAALINWVAAYLRYANGP